MLTRPRLSVETAWLLVVALAKLVLHFAVNLFGAYGYIRDELYYLACSDHLAWGYVDHPPLSIAVLWGVRHVLGDSLFALRLIPAVCGGAVVVLAGLVARELGGGRAAQVLAAVFTAASPLLLGMDSLYSMNALDIHVLAVGTRGGGRARGDPSRGGCATASCRLRRGRPCRSRPTPVLDALRERTPRLDLSGAEGAACRAMECLKGVQLT